MSGATLAELSGTYARSFLSALGMHANDLGRLYATAYAFERGIIAGRFTEEEAQRYFEQLDEYWRSLPAERFPHLHAIVGVLTTPDEDPEARFRFGLEMLVTGIAAQR